MKFNDKRFCGNEQRVFRARYKILEPGVVSHITQRAAGKEPLFIEDDDYLLMLGLLKESSEKFQLRYYSLCLMPNHLHLLLRPDQKNLDQAMRWLFSRYASRFNKRYQRKGHLFGGPYRQSVCLDNTYLITASVYIHLNPVRAGLIQNALSYRWSSISLYCGNTPIESFVDPNFVLGLMDDQLETSREHYSLMIKQAHGYEPDNALEQEGAIEKFCIRLSEMFPRLFNRLAGKPRPVTGQPPSMLDITTLENHLRIIDSEEQDSLKRRKARKYIIKQLLARGYKKNEIAQRLGITRRTVYNLLNEDRK